MQNSIEYGSLGIELGPPVIKKTSSSQNQG